MAYKRLWRGLNYRHLTQNENEEKINNDKIIGRFGVGLKDALATFYRHGVKVKILSKYGIITLKQATKLGFDDITTLHAEIDEMVNQQMVGTEFILEGCSDGDIEKAKALFLKFSDAEILESNNYGQVIKKTNDIAFVYINGVEVAKESNFLFSYNITSLTKQLKKTLNRERINVGRSAYTDRVKAILMSCKSDVVIQSLADDLQEMGSGNRHDELSWNDISLYASQKVMRQHQNVTFVTTDDLQKSPDIIDDMKTQGLKPIVVTNSLIDKMESYNKDADEESQIKTTNQFLIEQSKRMDFEFVDIEELTVLEREVYEKTEGILALIGGKTVNVEEICISETIYASELYAETVGLWQADLGRIIIKRKQLESLEKYAGTLLHECVHAISGATDVSRIFEEELTDLIGILAERAMNNLADNDLTILLSSRVDIKRMRYASHFNTLGITSVRELANVATVTALKVMLEDKIRSLELSYEACEELLEEIDFWAGIEIEIADNIEPDVNFIPKPTENKDIAIKIQNYIEEKGRIPSYKELLEVEKLDNNKIDIDRMILEHQKALNYASWLIENKSIEWNNLIFNPSQEEALVEKGVCYFNIYDEESLRFEFEVGQKVWSNVIYPYNLWRVIFRDSYQQMIFWANRASLLEQMDKCLGKLPKVEEQLVRYYYQKGGKLEYLADILVGKENDVIYWGVQEMLKRKINRCLRKLRHPTKSRYLKGYEFVSESVYGCDIEEKQKKYDDFVNEIKEKCRYECCQGNEKLSNILSMYYTDEVITVIKEEAMRLEKMNMQFSSISSVIDYAEAVTIREKKNLITTFLPIYIIRLFWELKYRTVEDIVEAYREGLLDNAFAEEELHPGTRETFYKTLELLDKGEITVFRIGV